MRRSSPDLRPLLLEALRRGLTLPAAPAEPDRPLTFREFIAKVSPRYRFYRHCDVLIDVLQRVADGELNRVLVSMPPRHGKSETVSRLFPAYYLYRHPHRFVGVNSYAAELAYTLSRAARENYTRAGGTLKDDAAAVKHWETAEGGGLWAAGVGGPITGKGFHLGLIDDPLKNAEEAASEVIRSKQKDWYGSTFYTREEPGGAIVVVQTRWHDDDLTGWLLANEMEDDEPERWHVVNFEAIKEDATPELPPTCTAEPDSREPGEALCPERYPLPKLRKILKRIGEYFFSALFQGRPRPKAGGLFPPGSLEIVDAAPVGLDLVRYWDKAGAAPGRGDWTVGVLLGRDEGSGLFYVVDVVRGQWPADERNRVILQTAHLDDRRRESVDIWVERPPGLAKESAEAVVRLLAGFNVRVDPVSKDKVERAEPLSAQARAGNVKVVKAAWNKPYLDVMHAFPFGAHDDDVDATSGAFNRLAPAGRFERTGNPFER